MHVTDHAVTGELRDGRALTITVLEWTMFQKLELTRLVYGDRVLLYSGQQTSDVTLLLLLLLLLNSVYAVRVDGS